MRTFRLPDLGEGLRDAEVVSWHAAVGDHVIFRIGVEDQFAAMELEIRLVAFPGADGVVFDVVRGVDHQHDQIEREFVQDIDCGDQMADVRRVERAAEQADAQGSRTPFIISMRGHDGTG